MNRLFSEVLVVFVEFVRLIVGKNVVCVVLMLVLVLISICLVVWMFGWCVSSLDGRLFGRLVGMMLFGSVMVLLSCWDSFGVSGWFNSSISVLWFLVVCCV